MKKVLITGSNGFLGLSLSDILEGYGYEILRGGRKVGEKNSISYGDLRGETRWTELLRGVDCIIHTAGLVHQPSNRNLSFRDYQQINVLATKNLAQQAYEVGVKRIIFISSIKVNGESTVIGSPFLNTDKPSPKDWYAKTKWMAEQELWAISKKFGIEVVVIRVPLIYGPGVKGNFKSLIKAINFGIPIPFGKVCSNKRSFIGVHNLADFVSKAIDSKEAAGNTYLVADGDDVSTSELIRLLANALDKKIFLLPIPEKILGLVSKIIRCNSMLDKLSLSLQIDIKFASKSLGWEPLLSFAEGLKRYFGRNVF
jgi:UDP-glucose 4-epimerase